MLIINPTSWHNVWRAFKNHKTVQTNSTRGLHNKWNFVNSSVNNTNSLLARSKFNESHNFCRLPCVVWFKYLLFIKLSDTKTNIVSGHGPWSGWWSVIKMMVRDQDDGPWSGWWSMIKMMVRDQDDGPWSGWWSMIKMMVHDQDDGPWSRWWSVIRMMVHDQDDGPWSGWWCMIKMMVHDQDDGP